MHRNRPTDTITTFMNAFKQFEKKLDKLQSDVNYHGHTLKELRMMVANLAVNINTDGRRDDPKRPRKTTAIQYESRYHHEEPKPRRKGAFQPLPRKLKAKSLQDQKRGQENVSPTQMQKLSSPIVTKRKRITEVKKTLKAVEGEQQYRNIPRPNNVRSIRLSPKGNRKPAIAMNVSVTKSFV